MIMTHFLNPDEYDEHNVCTIQSESPLTEAEPLTRHCQELTNYMSINFGSATSTRSRHSGNIKPNTSNSNTVT